MKTVRYSQERLLSMSVNEIQMTADLIEWRCWTLLGWGKPTRIDSFIENSTGDQIFNIFYKGEEMEKS